MIIREMKRNLGAAKELKVKIPVDQHVKLHTIKVCTGKQISATIEEALDAYFAARGQGKPLDAAVTVRALPSPEDPRDDRA